MKGILELSNLNDESVVIEEYKKFRESAFGFAYLKAAELLKNIICQSKQNRDECEIQIDNIISFEGRRGTGKTSAMMSIRNTLKNYKDVHEFIPGKDSDSASFTVIDYIDASMLEKGEDILEIVLANMFSMLTKKDREHSMRERSSYENRDLYRLFDEIYGILMGIKYRDERKSEISPLSLLNQLSSSQILKSKIKELVKQYLKYMNNDGDGGNRSNNHFLVITIDDLDMHFQSKEVSPFEMLETLHRYFMVPGVIILLTYNYYDLLMGCEKHFRQIYYKADNNLTEKEKTHIAELAADYLKKVLPIYTRIHMPSLKKQDYVEEDNILIKLEREETVNILGKFEYSLWKNAKADKYLLNLKRFVLLLKASTADLYYDAMGKKRHFAVPSDLRELAQTYTFYRQLLELSRQEEDGEYALFKEILDDLYFRFAKVRLLPEENARFEHYLEVPLERRSKDILGELRAFADEKGINLSQITYRSEAKVSYSYGELLYGLYNASHKGWFSKPLVWCILDSYTVMLTKLYRKMKYTVDEDEKNKIKSRLMNVVGASVSSSWSNLFVPRVTKLKIMPDKNGSHDFDYRVLESEGRIVKAAAIKYGASTVQWSFNLESSLDSDVQEKQLQMLEILCMFFTQVFHRVEKHTKNNAGFKLSYSSGNLKYTNGLIPDVGMNEIPAFQIEFSYGCFNIMNFVNNLLAGDSFYTKLHEQLGQVYTEYYKDLMRHSNLEKTPEEKVEELFHKHSLKQQYDDWYKETQGFAMPIYSFDMMYNILKRQYQNSDMLPEFVDAHDFWSYIKATYEGIGALLKEEDEFYFSNFKGENTDDSYRFSDAYFRCPFLTCIDQFMKDESWKQRFEQHFADMILTLVQTV